MSDDKRNKIQGLGTTVSADLWPGPETDESLPALAIQPTPWYIEGRQRAEAAPQKGRSANYMVNSMVNSVVAAGS
jgi:hypothetical protein